MQTKLATHDLLTYRFNFYETIKFIFQIHWLAYGYIGPYEIRFIFFQNSVLFFSKFIFFRFNFSGFRFFFRFNFSGLLFNDQIKFY